MKNIFKSIVIIACTCVLSLSCSKFLDRPAEDSFNSGNFYSTDEQLRQGVNYIYNSPWYDFQRGFIKIGEVMSGNMYWGSSPYMDFSTNGTDIDLVNMSYSLWAVNGHANAVIANILASSGPSQAAKNKYIGEALTLKALAYFFMVRTFGEVPIVHDNTALIGSGDYNKVTKAPREDVYEYIIMTLEKAMQLLPKDPQIGVYNRIDYYAAEGLLAKVYLTKAGLSGTLDAQDLEKAAEYALDVINNSGRSLTPNYSDIFRMAPATFNQTGECMISWQWTAQGTQWTRQNTLQSDLAYEGFGDQGDLWGGWGGPSVDLADAFGVSVLDDPSVRLTEKDTRRKCTMMMIGDTYPYFWRNEKGGFDFGKFLYDENWGLNDKGAKKGPGQMQCATGTQNVKHLYGNDEDHIAEVGHAPGRMAYTLPTHILRLADVYLVYAEAVISSNPSAALRYVNMVRDRAGVDPLPDVTMQDIWKERRLELAGEGDYWYDFVRRSYWQPDEVIAEIKAQRRSTYTGDLAEVYKTYVQEGAWDIIVLDEPDGDSGVSGWVENAKGQVWYGNNGVKGNEDQPNITRSSFTLPFPTEDVVFNGAMASDATPVHVDVRSTYHYNF